MRVISKLIVISLLLIPAFAVTAHAYKGGIFSFFQSDKKPQELKKEPITIVTKEGRRYQLDVEVADTERTRQKGLMHREKLDVNSGMLFLFKGEQRLSFWMKNTLIPLDIIFVRQDGLIDHIHSNARPLDETRVTSRRDAMAVLEINGGQADSWGIKEGDIIHHPAFNNINLLAQ